MKKAELEIVLFDARDIIATSGEGDDPHATSIENIWLSPESIANFNGLYPDDYNLQEKSKMTKLYYAFSGVFDEDDEVWQIAQTKSDELTESERAGLMVVGKNDFSGYNAVLKWLNDNRSTL